jgi:tetratricopeptide (TPR) repeat protein
MNPHRTRSAIPGLVLSLALASCAMPTRRPEIRQISKGVIEPSKTPLLERGRSMFALGEYGLAIEAFRRAARETPEDPAGYNGLAASYDMIGRFDLSRRNYELALAVAPDDARIYRNMARSLDMQGDRAGALALRAEADLVASAGPAPVEAAVSAVPEQETPAPSIEVAAAPIQEPAPVFEVPAIVPPTLVLSVPKIAVAVEQAPQQQSVERTLTLRRGHQIALALEEDRPAAGKASVLNPPRLATAVQNRSQLVQGQTGEVLLRTSIAPARLASAKAALPAPTKTVLGRKVSIPLPTLTRTATYESPRAPISIMNAGGRSGLARPAGGAWLDSLRNRRCNPAF